MGNSKTLKRFAPCLATFSILAICLIVVALSMRRFPEQRSPAQ